MASIHVQWKLDTLGKEESVLVGPDFRGCNVHKLGSGTVKRVLIIEVASFQGVLILGIALYIWIVDTVRSCTDI